jgi:hypothetical protein
VAAPGQPPIRLSLTLSDRCCGNQFSIPLTVPAEAGDGPAKVTLTFPDCPGEKVTPATVEVPVRDP